MCVHTQSLQSCPTLCDLRTVALQAPLSMGLSSKNTRVRQCPLSSNSFIIGSTIPLSAFNRYFLLVLFFFYLFFIYFYFYFFCLLVLLRVFPNTCWAWLAAVFCYSSFTPSRTHNTACLIRYFALHIQALLLLLLLSPSGLYKSLRLHELQHARVPCPSLYPDFTQI